MKFVDAAFKNLIKRLYEIHYIVKKLYLGVLHEERRVQKRSVYKDTAYLELENTHIFIRNMPMHKMPISF